MTSSSVVRAFSSSFLKLCDPSGSRVQHLLFQRSRQKLIKNYAPQANDGMKNKPESRHQLQLKLYAIEASEQLLCSSQKK